MRIVAYRFNSKGEYVEPVYIYPNEEDEYVLPENCTLEELPQPNWKPVFIDGRWVETVTEEELLEPLKMQKMRELNKMCNYIILGRFISVVDGEKYYFSNDMEAQANFEKCDRAFEKGRLTEIVWTCYDEHGNIQRITLTPETFEGVYISHLAHINDNISKFRDTLMPLVESAESEDRKSVV